jgi:tRNA threonylcarbamoyl adenosine modification protein YjeE
MNASDTITLSSLEDTKILAGRVAALLRVGDVLGLSGDLGAGKTTFAAMVIEALGGGAGATSPTFTLLQTYQVQRADGTPTTLYHYDLYRITHLAELEELGLREAHAGITLIEWPERLNDAAILTYALRLELKNDGTRTASLHKMSA